MPYTKKILIENYIENNYIDFSFFRTYQCVNNKCQRTPDPVITLDPIDLKQKNQHTTLSACRLVCGESGSLWPIPTGFLDIGRSVR